jgi:hypothetical protein
MQTATIPLPDLDRAEVVVPAPEPGPGNWAGAATATVVDDHVYLAYRVRRPLNAGRGVSSVVARSADGVHFETVSEVWRKDFRAESFERPIVLRTPEGTWRLYVSCATPDSKHWWIEAIDADRPEDFGGGRRTVVLPGSDTVAVKDPVIVVDAQGGWHAWICEHPLTDTGAEDRMSTAYHHSVDGLAWERRGTVLAPRGGAWDARGARVSDVVSLDPLVVLYDGRPRAEDNWHETTGVARAITPSDPSSVLVADEGEPLRSAYSDGACRYATSVVMPDGTLRYYLEVARPDGAHDLVTGTGRAG